MQNMNIGQAIVAMMDGHKCRRAGWIDRDRWVTIEPAQTAATEQFGSQANRDYVEAAGGRMMIHPFFTMKKPDGGIMIGWSPTTMDALAFDWYVVPTDGPDPYAHTYTKP